MLKTFDVEGYSVVSVPENEITADLRHFYIPEKILGNDDVVDSLISNINSVKQAIETHLHNLVIKTWTLWCQNISESKYTNDDQAYAFSSLVDGTFPPVLSTSFVGFRIQKTSKYAYVTFHLSGVKQELYGIWDANNKHYVPCGDPKQYATITRGINDLVPTIDSNTSVVVVNEGYGEAPGVHRYDSVSNALYMLPFLLFDRTYDYLSSPYRYLWTMILHIPRIEYTKNRVKLSGLSLKIGETSSHLRHFKAIQGMKVVKGVWKTTSDKGNDVQVDEDTILENFHAFVENPSSDPLLNSIYSVDAYMPGVYAIKNKISGTQEYDWGQGGHVRVNATAYITFLNGKPHILAAEYNGELYAANSKDIPNDPHVKSLVGRLKLAEALQH